jgi:hypothetical protein
MSHHDTLEIRLSNRLYRCASQLDVFRKIGIVGADGGGFKLAGAGTSAAGYQLPSLYFHNNTPGIVVHYPTTRLGTGTYSTAPTADSFKPYFRNLALIGTSKLTGSSGNHGIVCHRSITISDFSVQRFSGNGIQVLATAASSSGATYGNANTCHISRGYINGIGGTGLLFNGGDSNTAVIDTVSFNDCGTSTSAATIATSAATIIADNLATSSTTSTPSVGSGTLTVTAAAGHNLVTGMYAELVQINNSTYDLDESGTVGTEDLLMPWASGQVTVSGNSITWTWTASDIDGNGSNDNPPSGQYKIRTGAGATTVTGSDTTTGEGRVVWCTVAAGTPTLVEGQTVQITGFDKISATELTTVHKAYDGLIGVICPDKTYSSSGVKDPDLAGALTTFGGAADSGNIDPLAAQLYASNFLPNLYMNLLFGPTINGGFKCYDDSGSSTFLSCYSEGSNSTQHFFNGTGVAIGGNLPVPGTEAESHGLVHIRGDGQGKLRVSRGLEVFTNRYNNGSLMTIGGDWNSPDQGFFALGHTQAMSSNTRLMFEHYSYGQNGGWIQLINSNTNGYGVLDIPHFNNNRNNKTPGFPAGIMLQGIQGDANSKSYQTQNVHPETSAYLGFFLVTTGFPCMMFGDGAAEVITNTSDSGGLVRVTVSTVRGITAGDRVLVTNVAGTTEANGYQLVNAVSGTTGIDLAGTTYANAYDTGTATLSAGSYDSSTDLTTFTYSGLSNIDVGDRVTLSGGTGGVTRRDLLVAAKDTTALTISIRYTSTLATETAANKHSGYVQRVHAVGYNTTYPSAGTWGKGDIIYNTAPGTEAAEYWVCTTGGTSGGTWLACYPNHRAYTVTGSVTRGHMGLIRVPFTAGAGAATSVTVYNANCPVALRVVQVYAYVSDVGSGASREAALYSSTGGGGTKLSASLATTGLGYVPNTSDTGFTATQTIAANGSLYLYRPNDSTAGEFYIVTMEE